MVDLDIDIWGRGRDAAQAGRHSEPMMKACYPYVELPPNLPLTKLIAILKEHFSELNAFDQRTYYHNWSCIFFQSREDAELFRGLLYVY